MTAVRLRVFYDEWATAELWGRNLFEYLDVLYRTQTRFCVLLAGRNYAASDWPRHELRAIQERLLHNREDFLLPVRLDDSEVPGIRSTTGFVRYPETSASKIAQLILEKLHANAGRHAATPPTPTSAQSAFTPASRSSQVNGFTRQAAEKQVVLRDGQLSRRALACTPGQDKRFRWKVAAVIARVLNFEFRMGLQAALSCWRDEERFFLSTLPSVVHGAHRTLEFLISPVEDAADDAAAASLVLQAEWVHTTGDRWGPIAMDTFHGAVKNVYADRNGCNMLRESVLYVLKTLGRQFRFPVVPHDGDEEALCGWLSEEPPNDWFDWDRDPRRAGAGFACWRAVYQEPTGEGLLVFTVQGGWSNNALYALYDSLETFLSDRHERTLLDRCARICVHLGNFGSPETAAADRAHARDAASRVYACLGRMVAAQREIPIDEPSMAARLPPLRGRASEIFEDAVAALGREQLPKVIKNYPRDGIGPWVQLHHSEFADRTDLTWQPDPFDFFDVATRAKLLDYIAEHEREHPQP